MLLDCIRHRQVEEMMILCWSPLSFELYNTKAVEQKDWPTFLPAALSPPPYSHRPTVIYAQELLAIINWQALEHVCLRRVCIRGHMTEVSACMILCTVCSLILPACVVLWSFVYAHGVFINVACRLKNV